MKKTLAFLLALASFGSAGAQSTSCQALLDSINRSYDEQEKAISANPRINATDRDYRSLMLYFYRNDRLSKQEAACNNGGATRYKSCLEQANALNRSYNNQLSALRNRRGGKQDKVSEMARLNAERNDRLRTLRETCAH